MTESASDSQRDSETRAQRKNLRRSALLVAIALLVGLLVLKPPFVIYSLPGRFEAGSQPAIIAGKNANLALDEVDFTVYTGAVNVLIGESGAGKSTLMKILAGVERPTSGRFLLDGVPVEFRSAREASRAGIGINFPGVESLSKTQYLGEHLCRPRSHTAALPSAKRRRRLLASCWPDWSSQWLVLILPKPNPDTKLIMYV